MLAGVDGNSTWARRLRDVMALHISDLGGDANVSEAERSIVRRAATLTVELELMEVAFATDDKPSDRRINTYQRTANSLRRLLESVGMKRVARDVTPTVEAYLSHLDEVKSDA